MGNSNPFVGQWTASDGLSNVVLVIEEVSDGYSVMVVDQSDSEEAEVYDVEFEEDVLSFKIHWESNGQFVKYQFRLLSDNTLGVTYTFSAQETWLKVEE